MDGKYALIGAKYDDDSGSNSGSSYVFSSYNDPPSADFSYIPLHPSISEIIQFTDTSTDTDGNVTQWHWDFGDGNTSTDQNTTHQYSTAGAYAVTLEVTDDDGATDAISKTVFVGIIPTNFSTLTIGWNLKSPPGPDEVNKTDLIIFYDGCYYNWPQACAFSIIDTNVFGWSGVSYFLADVLYPSEGYWIYSYEPCMLKVIV
ncbi:MAG: PKD domain-containing protein [Candidatus Heimdallarchaeota archaeon]|nr:PKD domain-containing protein [Candidatus Heimdallarchaeota archaeon]